MPKTNPVHLSLRKALTSDRLEEFIDDEEHAEGGEIHVVCLSVRKTGRAAGYAHPSRCGA